MQKTPQSKQRSETRRRIQGKMASGEKQENLRI